MTQFRDGKGRFDTWQGTARRLHEVPKQNPFHGVSSGSLASRYGHLPMPPIAAKKEPPKSIQELMDSGQLPTVQEVLDTLQDLQANPSDYDDADIDDLLSRIDDAIQELKELQTGPAVVEKWDPDQLRGPDGRWIDDPATPARRAARVAGKLADKARQQADKAKTAKSPQARSNAMVRAEKTAEAAAAAAKEARDIVNKVRAAKTPAGMSEEQWQTLLKRSDDLSSEANSKVESTRTEVSKTRQEHEAAKKTTPKVPNEPQKRGRKGKYDPSKYGSKIAGKLAVIAGLAAAVSQVAEHGAEIVEALTKIKDIFLGSKTTDDTASPEQPVETEQKRGRGRPRKEKSDDLINQFVMKFDQTMRMRMEEAGFSAMARLHELSEFTDDELDEWLSDPDNEAELDVLLEKLDSEMSQMVQDAKKAEWDESKHPRGEDGKFAPNPEAQKQKAIDYSRKVMPSYAEEYKSRQAASSKMTTAQRSRSKLGRIANKFTSWYRQHKDLIDGASSVAGIVGGVSAVAAFALRLQDRQEKEREKEKQDPIVDLSDEDMPSLIRSIDLMEKPEDELTDGDIETMMGALDELAAVITALPIDADKAEWDEAKHPRADDGKFTNGNGGSSNAAKSKYWSSYTPQIARTILSDKTKPLHDRIVRTVKAAGVLAAEDAKQIAFKLDQKLGKAIDRFDQLGEKPKYRDAYNVAKKPDPKEWTKETEALVKTYQKMTPEERLRKALPSIKKDLLRSQLYKGAALLAMWAGLKRLHQEQENVQYV